MVHINGGWVVYLCHHDNDDIGNTSITHNTHVNKEVAILVIREGCSK